MDLTIRLRQLCVEILEEVMGLISWEEDAMEDVGCGVRGGVLKLRLTFFRFRLPLGSEVKLPSSTFTPTSPHLTSPASHLTLRHLVVNRYTLTHHQYARAFARSVTQRALRLGSHD